MAYLSHLSLTNFRNILELDLDLPRGVAVFSGSNAQGKTSLLEAVYLLAIARSFRAENEREVVNFRAADLGGQGLVGGTIEKKGERLQVYVGYQCSPVSDAEGRPTRGLGARDGFVRKQIRVSRMPRTAAQLVGTVNAVLFTAADIDLVQGPPAGRRRFLDVLTSQADPLYLQGLKRYQKVVQQRNKLLKLLQDGRAGADELAFWNDELVREGSWITWRRRAVIRELARSGAQHHLELAGPGEEFTLAYQPSVPADGNLEDVEEQFRQSLAAGAPREIATASTAVGPHRDDFGLLIDEVDMGTFGSRGQARTLALALRLAEASYLNAVRSEAPIVLLDDVLSEMDSARRNRILDKATQYQQSLITTTDREPLHAFFGPSATYFRVADGGVKLCPSSR